MNERSEAKPGIPLERAGGRPARDGALAPSPARAATLVDRVLALRDPLCRAELAASRIARDAWNAPHELAREIRAAISEIDERIDAVVASLRAPNAAPDASEDAHAVVASVLERMFPVLDARAVRAVLVPPAPGADALTTLDPAVLRRAVLVALRVAIATLPHGGRLALELIDGPCLGLRMRRFAAPNAALAERGANSGAIEPLRSMAAGVGGWLDVQADPEAAFPALCLWLGGAEPLGHGEPGAAAS